MQNTRHVIEAALSQHPAIKPLDENAIHLINSHKNGDYGFSYLGLRTSGRPDDPRMPSEKFPQGVIYHDDSATFGIRITPYEPQPDKTALVIIAPCGNDWVNVVNAFGAKIEKQLPDLLVFMRHITEQDKQELGVLNNVEFFVFQNLLEQEWLGMDFLPWQKKDDSGAYIVSDDQEFDHRMLDASKIVANFDGNITTRSKKRGKDTRHFFEKNGLELEWRSLGDMNRSDALKLVESHFSDSVSRSFYGNVLSLTEAEMQAANIVSKIAYLKRSDGVRLPIGFFTVEDTAGDQSKFAMYAGFSNNTKEYTAKIAVDTKDVREISRYILWSFLQEVKNQYPQVKQFDFGGSEIPSLDAFKKDIGCEPLQTHWAVSLQAVRSGASIVNDLVKK